jgi:hypothetical protein
MSNRLLPSQVGERVRAVQRLQSAEAEQSRLRGEHERAQDAPDGARAAASLRTADDQVLARKRWLKSVEDHHEDHNG